MTNASKEHRQLTNIFTQFFSVSIFVQIIIEKYRFYIPAMVMQKTSNTELSMMILRGFRPVSTISKKDNNNEQTPLMAFALWKEHIYTWRY